MHKPNVCKKVDIDRHVLCITCNGKYGLPSMTTCRVVKIVRTKLQDDNLKSSQSAMNLSYE